MKILLINPPTPNIIRESLPPVIEDDSGLFPPLGLMYIAAYAEDIEGCTVQIIDCVAEKMDHEALAAKIREIAPDIVGIQAMSFVLIDAIIVAKNTRKQAPDAFIVFGGPHPTLYPKETVVIPEVDAIVAGEGEYTFSAIVKALIAKKPLEGIPGVLTKKTPDLKMTTWKHIENLDELKMPARHLIDKNNYNSPMARKNPITTIISTRGCPARCGFCNRPQMGKTFRMISAENVVKEMRYCVEEMGIGEIFFYDDTFSFNQERVWEICDLIIKQGLKVLWDVRTRADTITPELIHRMRQAGCHRIHYGIEAGSPRIQKRLGKDLDLTRLKKIFTFTKKEGIEILAYFMIGCPDETVEDLQKTFDLMLELPMDYAHIAIFTPYPDTPIYQEGLDSGLFDHDYWLEFAKNPKADFSPRYWTQHFSEDELQNYIKKSYARFYARPGYLINRLFNIRSFDELVRKAGLGLKLLKSMGISKS